MVSGPVTQLFVQGIGTKNVFKEVMEFLNLTKLCLTQSEAVRYYKHKLILLNRIPHQYAAARRGLI